MNVVVEKHKAWIILSLAVLISSTICAGIYLKHYFVVSVFSAWVTVEFLTWRLRGVWPFSKRIKQPFRFKQLNSLITLYGKYDTVPEGVIAERIFHLRLQNQITEEEARWLERLKDLMELRGLAYGKRASGKKGLRQDFIFFDKTGSRQNREERTETFSIQDITESAIHVAGLYWKLFEVATGNYPELTKSARRMIGEMFGLPSDDSIIRDFFVRLTDEIQRDSGLPFLVLNLLKLQYTRSAKQISEMLLQEQVELDEDVRSALYWVSEIYLFTRHEETVITDYASSIRYLYHVCFTNPERAAFLEIDGQFFSQFETVNELAREGFLFREALIEKTLMLWREHDVTFDEVFQSVMEAMTQKKSKIYDEREMWERFWKREKDGFSRDYLYVVEGNLSFAAKQYEDARVYYERAVKLNPEIRSARLNLLFCYARLDLEELHDLMAERLVSDRTFFPSALYAIGNSFLLLGNEEKADLYYSELKKQSGWELKTEYYKSTFCFENGLYEKALQFAKIAHELNPLDASISYHLSLCYQSVGETDRALELIKHIDDTPEWLNYYRFTLERDSGRVEEASQTLLQIPHDYFQDSEELEAALDFARDRQDLVLLRHLRKGE
jgi:tetratricopeptide (TPR) repeat protein